MIVATLIISLVLFLILKLFLPENIIMEKQAGNSYKKKQFANKHLRIKKYYLFSFVLTINEVSNKYRRKTIFIKNSFTKKTYSKIFQKDYEIK